MSWKVEVLIFKGPTAASGGLSIARWETVGMEQEKRAAETLADQLFEHGYTSKPGENWRVMGTRVEEIEG